MPQTIEIGKGIISIEVDTKKGTLSWQQMEEQAKNSLQKLENQSKQIAESTSKTFASLGKSIGTAFQMIAANIVVQTGTKIIKSLSDAQLKAIQFADEIDKSSKRLQMSATAYQQYTLMAKLSGIETDSFSMAMKRLSETMFNAYKGNKEAANLFKALSIEIKNTDGTLKNLDTILPEIADKISKIEDPTLKVALATELFGRTGNMLIPMLDSGGKAIIDTQEKIKQLGLTIDDNMVQALVHANDKLEILSRQLEIAKVKATGSTEPLALLGKNIMIWLYSALEKVNNAVQKFFGFWLDIWGKIAGTKIYNIIDKIFGVNTENTKKIENTLKTFSNISQKLNKQNQTDEGKILEIINKQNIDIEKQKKLQEEKLNALKGIADAWAQMDSIIDDINSKYNTQIATKEEIRQKIFEILNASKDWESKLKDVEALLTNIKNEANIKVKMEANAEEAAKDISDIKNLYVEKSEEMPPIEVELPAKIELTPELVKLDKEAFKKKLQEYADLASEISGIASEFGASFSAMAEAGMINQKQQLKFQKAVLIIQMTMDAYAGIARAIATAGPYGILIGLATFAKIMAYIAKLKSMEIPETPKVKYPKMAQGGIIMQRQIVEVAENNKPEAILPLDRLEQILNQQQEIKITLNVSDKASFLRGLTAEIEKIKRKEYV